MPPEGRALGFTTSVRTSSFNISAIVNVKQSRKSPQNLKIAVAKESGTKTYELEAENPRIASDIVTIIKDLYVVPPPRLHQTRSRMLTPLVFQHAPLPRHTTPAAGQSARPAQPEQNSTTTARSLKPPCPPSALRTHVASEAPAPTLTNLMTLNEIKTTSCHRSDRDGGVRLRQPLLEGSTCQRREVARGGRGRATVRSTAVWSSAE
jgi:hypothetical protein